MGVENGLQNMDQKTLIAIAVGVIVVIAIVAVFLMGGHHTTSPKSSNQSKIQQQEQQNANITNSTTTNIVAKTVTVDKKEAIKNEKFILNFAGYEYIVSDCLKNGNYVLATKVYSHNIPTGDEIIYDTKNKKLYIVNKGNVYYAVDVILKGDVTGCKATTKDITKGLDLNKAKPIGQFFYG